MIERLTVTALISFAGLAALADGPDPASYYFLSCNPNGMIVEVADGRTYFLGKDCDAARAQGPAGLWISAPYGAMISLPDETVQFEAYLWCDALPTCQAE